MTSIRVLVVDDDELMREALKSFLEAAPDIDVVGTAGDGVAAVELAERLRPDVVVLDMQMPRQDGVATTRELQKRRPEIRVLAVSSFATDRYVIAALREGASGYVVKDTTPDQLVAAVRRVAGGDETVSPQVLNHLVDAVRASGTAETPTPPETVDRFLSDREREVITLLARGKSNGEIADRLFIAEATVKSHVSRIMSKLNVRDRVQIVIRAHQWGLADLDLDD